VGKPTSIAKVGGRLRIAIGTAAMSAILAGLTMPVILFRQKLHLHEICC
jgi:hypothetical protein